LPLASHQATTHDDFIDMFGSNASALKRCGNRHSAQVIGCKTSKIAKH
jgi:hypothetical protein